MAIFKLEPINFTTTGSLSATVTGIEPNRTDFIVGSVTAKDGVTEVKWDKNGNCTNQATSANLNSNSEEFKDIIAAAKKLGLV